jgi:hypothetical protein
MAVNQSIVRLSTKTTATIEGISGENKRVDGSVKRNSERISERSSEAE